MARTGLYRSIVAFGVSLGAGAPLAAAFFAPACDLYFDPAPAPPDAWHATIADAPIPDAWHGIIDAALPPDAWPTIADAPNPDAGNGGQS